MELLREYRLPSETGKRDDTMEKKAHALAAGIFVLVASALLAGLAVWLTRDRANTTWIYEITTHETVSACSHRPHALSGVDVGKVASITFDPATRGNVLLQLQIDENAP